MRLQFYLQLLIAIPILVTCTTAAASQELAQKRKCMVCHAFGEKLVGPALKDVANLNLGRSGADAYLSKKIRNGGIGRWGQVRMPAMEEVSEEEALALARWILQLR